MRQGIYTIHETGTKTPHILSGFALFRLGFRPFFLFGALFGACAPLYFILSMSGIAPWISAWDVISWHRHEMLFGFTSAIIAGFLLTAVPNWTGHPTVKGTRLALLVLLWFSGRVAVFASSHLPVMLVAVLDVSFFLACAASILPALVKSQNKRNYFFVPLLVLLSTANGLTHWGNSYDAAIAATGLQLGLNITILIMVIIGGRVIPFFTERPLGITIKRSQAIERFTLISTIAALALDILAVKPMVLGGLFLLAFVANGWRLSQWQTLKTMRTPILWILHTGYAWLVVGLLMKAIYLLGFGLSASIATHAFTAGGIGALTLGMISRVSPGHSGRPLTAGRLGIISFYCINLTALCRVFGILLLPEYTTQLLEMAAVFWLLAFGIFVIVYAPILMRPRIDGRDG